jgi:hypothetical protein
MSDVMCIVTNHEEKQAELLFRVESALFFVMSDVIFIVLVRDCRKVDFLLFGCNVRCNVGGNKPYGNVAL